MKNILSELQIQSELVEELAGKAESGEAYLEELKSYLPVLNQTIVQLFEIIREPRNNIDISQDFVLQVLNDIIYGIEKEDSVCLADVLRYGLVEVFNYIAIELQGEE